MYKSCIETYSGEQIFKADPYANYAELRPGTASRVADIETIKWTDTEWMTRRKTWNHKHEPMSVYEAHIGSWMRRNGLYTCGADGDHASIHLTVPGDIR